MVAKKLVCKLVYLGYVDGDAPLGWEVNSEGVWQLMPPVYAHPESVTERGGMPKAIELKVYGREGTNILLDATKFPKEEIGVGMYNQHALRSQEGDPNENSRNGRPVGRPE